MRKMFPCHNVTIGEAIRNYLGPHTEHEQRTVYSRRLYTWSLFWVHTASYLFSLIVSAVLLAISCLIGPWWYRHSTVLSRDVMTRKRFPHYYPSVWGIHQLQISQRCDAVFCFVVSLNKLLNSRCVDGQNTTFSSFLLKYRGRNSTNFPETWKRGSKRRSIYSNLHRKF